MLTAIILLATAIVFYVVENREQRKLIEIAQNEEQPIPDNVIQLRRKAK